MNTHEDTSSTLGIRALTTQTLDLAICIDLVVLQDGHLDLLALVLDLLGGLDGRTISVIAERRKNKVTNAVLLLLSLLGTTTQTEHQVKGRLLLDVVVAQSATILKLLAGEDETLLVRRDTDQTVR